MNCTWNPFIYRQFATPDRLAASLSRQSGLSSSHSQTLWLKTNLAALSYTRSSRRAIVDYDRWFNSGFEQARTLINSLNLPLSVNETQTVEAVNQVIRPVLRHYFCDEGAACWPIVAKFYSLLCRATTEGKIPDEIWATTETFEKATDLLTIWDDLVAERDAAIAERSATIAKRDVTIARLRKQRQLFTYIIISIAAVLSLISLFMLSYHN